MASQRHTTAMEFLQSYEDFDISRMLAIRTESCTHGFVTSLGENPINTNAQFAAFYEPIRPHLRRSKFTVKQIIEDDKANEIAVWCTVVIEFVNPAVAAYQGDYAFFLEFDDSQTKVARVREFVDRLGANEYLGQVEVAKSLSVESNTKAANRL
ncbi:uncharacterized protein Z518_04608 [Rhinocladiella mackenziei CBS 650.93]|uniref:SnoaL-like domain-containing protein n=1 Tax=Rhinocladiella mackenziei CBS 650.93 TaxID=1442369 RepID=A0A0D2FWM3_9EURO|nr:uncharacterized protein Z518_04608 [Rhinocladiella mackenziei CBS 650.93]KIX06632.1 hypothetical protein Z518_04608 [Rhinocladiella mackenziei CBS 650.93]